jgi:hypothetical protein
MFCDDIRQADRAESELTIPVVSQVGAGHLSICITSMNFRASRYAAYLYPAARRTRGSFKDMRIIFTKTSFVMLGSE